MEKVVFHLSKDLNQAEFKKIKEALANSGLDLEVFGPEVEVFPIDPAKRYMLRFKHELSQKQYEYIKACLEAENLTNCFVTGPNVDLEELNTPS